MILGQDQWEEDWEDDDKWKGKKWNSEKYDSYDKYDKRDKGGKSGKYSKYDDYDEYDASESWDRAACCCMFSFNG